jgi:hypothetical protein
VEKFGGTDGLAEEVKTVYDESDNAPTIRAKILDMVVSGVFGLPDEPPAAVASEDLVAEFRQLAQDPALRPLLKELLSDDAPNDA